MLKSRLMLVMALACAMPLARSYAAEQKWLRAASQHFELCTTENESKARAALEHFEAVRAYFLAVIHAPGAPGEPIRMVAFRSEGDFTQYRPLGSEYAKAFSRTRGVSNYIVVMNLNKELYEQGFREYVRMVLDNSAAALPYWLRMGLGEYYATL